MTKKLAGDNAAFDVHAMDPARLKAEVRKMFGLSPTKWECKECGKEVTSKTKPTSCTCGARGSYVDVPKK